MTSDEDMEVNIRSCSALIHQAAAADATLICTPENTARMIALYTEDRRISNNSRRLCPCSCFPFCCSEFLQPFSPGGPVHLGHRMERVWILVRSIAVRGLCTIDCVQFDSTNKTNNTEHLASFAMLLCLFVDALPSCLLSLLPSHFVHGRFQRPLVLHFRVAL